jgi:uncharacterized protein (TIGR03085 family)
MKRVSPSEHDYPAAPDETSVAQVERAQLCDLFEQVGPHAPTLCRGWETHHLAAHLVVREGTPLGILKSMARGSGDADVERLAGERDFASLVDEIRGGPPRLSLFGTGLTDKAFNGLEFLVHHEDVRRALAGFDLRDLPAWARDEVWSALSLALPGLMRKAPVGVALRRSDTGELKVASKKPKAVVVAGLPAELALFAFGRGSVADVSLDGNPADVKTLASAHFGF